MFNSGNFKVARSKYEAAEQSYKDAYQSMVDYSQKLYTSKNELALYVKNQKFTKEQLNTIDNILRYRNLQLEICAFERVKKITQKQINKNLDSRSSSDGVVAPSAIMALTTTFGVAPTGTAISTLSGAALTNATLAAIGGGSMAAGSAFLGLLGPIIGGLLIVSINGIRSNKKNKEAIEQFNKNRGEYEESTKQYQNVINRIAVLNARITDFLKPRDTVDHSLLPFDKQLDELLNGAQLLNTPVRGD